MGQEQGQENYIKVYIKLITPALAFSEGRGANYMIISSLNAPALSKSKSKSKSHVPIPVHVRDQVHTPAL